MRTTAILPVKSFPAAKQRLSGGLDAASRQRLVQAMFTDVLGALARSSVDGILVVTASAAARKLALQSGAAVLEDRETGHNDAVLLGIEASRERGADRVLLVPGDCPLLDPGEIDSLLARPITAPSLLVVPDRHGTGTNALLITPPGAITPSFGPGSCQRHMTLAAERGVSAEIVEVPSLALDIDTPEDLEALTALRC